MSDFLMYPIKYHPPRWQERIMTFMNSWAGFCPVCGKVTIFLMVLKENPRESCFCIRCRANNRKRQLAYIVCESISGIKNKKLRSLREIAKLNDIYIYNTEPNGAIHEILSHSRNYKFSGYFGAMHKSGDIIGKVEHQDLMALSLQDESVDLAISADVFEHMPDPYLAHREIYRILKPGGRHIFSVPFYQTGYLDEDRCIIKDGQEIHLKEPVYHQDPLRNEGALVYKIFSLEMLCKLKHLGFSTNMYCIYKPGYGIIGNNGLIFEAIKPL
ncbi:MAG: class I SAM-dependent methyltransferase [Nitrospirae bacterium]|nr:class I SAM-dependent methyltransferase [Nitrospirota bacterium]